MKGMRFIALAAVLAAGTALAAAPQPTVDDLKAAGYADASAVAEATDGRFGAPVRYFRSSERLSAADAKKDCADCADLISVYSAELPSPPDWAANQNFKPTRQIAGRWQTRGWLAAAKRILIVTGPNQEKVKALYDQLTETPAM